MKIAIVFCLLFMLGCQSTPDLKIYQTSGKDKALYGYKNIKNEIVIQARYTRVEDFSENLAVVQDAETGKYGYIDIHGDVVIPFIYDDACSFGKDRVGNHGFKGLAMVNLGNTEEYKYSLFSKGKWGLIDKHGNIVLPLKYAMIDPINEGLSRVNEGEYLYDSESKLTGVVGKYGFIDKKGNIVIEPRFDEADPVFTRGITKVEKDGESFYINKKGERVR